MHWFAMFVKGIEPHYFYEMIVDRIENRAYQCWVANIIWWQYNYTTTKSSCMLSQLASLNFNYVDLDYGALNDAFARIGIYALPEWKNVKQDPCQARRMHLPDLCLDERSAIYLKTGKLHLADLSFYW